MKKSTSLWIITLVVIACILVGGCKKKPKQEASPTALPPTTEAEVKLPTVAPKPLRAVPTQVPAGVTETRSVAKKLKEIAGVWETTGADGTIYRLEIKTERTYKLWQKKADGSYTRISMGKAKLVKNHVALIPSNNDTCTSIGSYKVVVFKVQGTVTKLVFHKLKDTCKARGEIVRGEWYLNLP